MNAYANFATLRNAAAIPREDVPALPFAAFRRAVIEAVAGGGRLAALFAAAAEDKAARGATAGAVEMYAVVADSHRAQLHVARTRLAADRYPALTPDCPQAHLFEREMAEQYGVVPEGHPWLKPVRFHPSYRPPCDAWGRPAGTRPLPGVMDYYAIQGDEIHEVAVGPVHAGVIEPGHFRFQCHGEHVFHLEISLGYQHRGAEPMLVGGPNKRTIHVMETAAGDTSVGHATAYCLAVEALADCRLSARAEALRGVALELERLANHVGDLGALAGDVAFLPTAAFCGRLRGDFLNLTALLCGSRFGRGMVRPGRVVFDLEADRQTRFLQRLAAAERDLAAALELLWGAASVQARFQGAGVVSPDAAATLGLVGPAARACGLERDIRQDFPWGIYRFVQIPVSTWATGDVFARAYVRGLEIRRSAEFIRGQLRALPQGTIAAEIGPPRPDRLAVALVEGWRGEICHVAMTDGAGRFSRYKIVDPSFHNWSGLAIALRDQQISDFPLCNKSFNLSYCGFDL